MILYKYLDNSNSFFIHLTLRPEGSNSEITSESPE